MADGLVEISPSRALITAGWEHIPHLTEQAKAELLAGTPPHLREARSTGAPSMGAGAIYPIPFAEISVKPFAIPVYWPRGYYLDVGWRVTAALWSAWDRETDTLYAYSEHYRKESLPAIHADAIKARGAWMKGGIDPAARGRNPKDGERLVAVYQGLGLNISPAQNAVEAGIYELWSRMETGRFKVFSTLAAFADEFRIYRRDDKGRVVKENDHLMDCARYTALGFRDVFITRPVDRAAGRGRVVGQETVGY